MDSLEEIRDSLRNNSLLVTDYKDLIGLYNRALNELIKYNDKFINLPRIYKSKGCSVPGLYYSIDVLDSEVFFTDYRNYDLLTVYRIESDCRSCLYRLYFTCDSSPKLFFLNNSNKKKVSLSDTAECTLKDLIKLVL